mmetsp:Transcript_27116/g.79141  ORF Transcript_27116/g.79141 Transcript_27116/m.79141 type:complete len:412 (-) Transcript_27116:686-1921(-)
MAAHLAFNVRRTLRRPSHRLPWRAAAGAGASKRCLKEAELGLVVRDEHVFGLAVVVEHHLVCLATEARLLVAAERRVRRVGVVAVDPDAARLDLARHRVRLVGVARPHAGAEAVHRVVCDGDGLLLVPEGGDARDGAEDLLLEDLHVVCAGEDGGLDVVAAVDHVVGRAAGEHLCALRGAEVDVVDDLLVLRARDLRPHHRRLVERVPRLDRLRARDDLLHELVVDVLLHEHPRVAGADLALVESEEDGALDRLVEELVVLVADRREEDVGRLASELECGRDELLCGALEDLGARRGRASETELGDAVAARQRRPRLVAVARHDVITPGGTTSLISSMSVMMEVGVCSAGLSTTQLPAARAGASFHAAMSSGKFHGMIDATTPSGSWMQSDTVLASISDAVPSSARITPAK